MLLFWLVGSVSPRLLGPRGFKRVRHLPPEAFDPLTRFVGTFPGIVTTPHVLTECSNLGRQLVGADRAAFSRRMGVALDRVMIERAIPSRRVCHADAHLVERFGLTDTLIRLASDGLTVVTDDRPLAAELAARSVPVLDLASAAKLAPAG